MPLLLSIPAGEDLHEEVLALFFVVVAHAFHLEPAPFEVWLFGALVCGATEAGKTQEGYDEAFQKGFIGLPRLLK